MLDFTMSEFEENPAAAPRMKAEFDADEIVFFVNEERVLWTDKITSVLKGRLVEPTVEIDCWCYILERSQLRFVDFGQKLPLFYTASGALDDAMTELENLKAELTNECDQIESDLDKLNSAIPVKAGY